MKDFLGFENARNKEHAALYTSILQVALQSERQLSVLIGHHLCLEINGDLNTENEIPAADTLIFDHEIMSAVFGDRAINIMQQLAAVPCQLRDEHLSKFFNAEMLRREHEKFFNAEKRALLV